MKKIFLIIVVFFGLQGHSQKIFKVYNYTNITFELHDIITNAAGAYPEFHSKGTTITLPPGGFYGLENTLSATRFPFDSTLITPYISFWSRVTPGSAIVMSSNAAWVLGTPQVFHRMLFGVPGVSYDSIDTVNSVVTGAGWTATYTEIVNSSSIVYLIVIN